MSWAVTDQPAKVVVDETTLDVTVTAAGVGPAGPAGPPGPATIDVGTTSTGAPGTSATVVNSGTSEDVILDFTIPAGADGEPGEPGEPGTPGEAATITVGTVTTGTPGSNVEIVNSGTTSAAILDFTIPAGDKGDQGDPGIPGDPGTPGATGPAGATGATGPAGPTGATGATGPKGDTGDTGPAGATGATGPAGTAATIAVGTVTTGAAGSSATVTNAGTSSDAVFNFAIPQGAKGDKGDTGATGPAGSSSKVTQTGVSLGSIAVSSSFTDIEVTTVVARGLVSLFTVTASAAGTFDIQVRSASAGAGTLFLEATGISATSYSITSPWYVEGDVNSSIWVRIKNRGTATVTFTLTDLRVEKFA